MKILVRLSAVVCSLLIALLAGAQEKTPLSFGLYTTLGAPEGLTIGGSVCFMPELSLRAGLGLMPSLSYSSRVDVDKVKAFASYAQKLENPVDLDINMKSGWVRGQLLLDYHPFRNPFRVTAGLFLGRYQARGSVQLVDHKTGKSVAEEARGEWGDSFYSPARRRCLHKRFRCVPVLGAALYRGWLWFCCASL